MTPPCTCGGAAKIAELSCEDCQKAGIPCICGTPEARLRAMGEFAQERCGYSPISSRPHELSIIDAFDAKDARIAELEQQLRRAKVEMEVRKSILWKPHGSEFYISGWLEGPDASRMTGLPFAMEDPNNWRCKDYAAGKAAVEAAIEKGMEGKQ